ncbi:MAG: class I SAM-dependent methyltransferase, partial [Steroidobacteraceae bacterium]
MAHTSSRMVLPELLDHLPPDDPQALRSRRDLQRIHVVMRTRAMLCDAIARLHLERPPASILELGAGDATLLLHLARKLAPRWPGVTVTVLDRVDLVSSATRDGFRALGWPVSVVTADILEWARAEPLERHDLCLTTLFLHHFTEPQLGAILAAVAARCRAFVACEPRRDLLTLLGSRCVAMLGSNRITREDAVTSVVAGFNGTELTQAWPDPGKAWIVDESRVFPFTHRF